MVRIAIYSLDAGKNEDAVCILNEGDHVIGRGILFGVR